MFLRTKSALNQPVFIMSFLASAGSALAAIGASSAKPLVEFFGGRSNMRLQNKLYRQNLKWNATSLPMLQRKGYEAAGYNPLLMYGASPVTAQMPSMAEAPSMDLAGDMSRMMEANTGREQMLNTKEYQNAVVKNERADVKNKEAQTEVLKAQAEETRLNNKEHRTLTNWRDKADVVLRALQTKLNYIGSSAGQTRTSLMIPGFFNRTESRDNFDSSGALQSIDKLINKYGDGLFDMLDRDYQFESGLGLVTNPHRTWKKLDEIDQERHKLRDAKFRKDAHDKLTAPDSFKYHRVIKQSKPSTPQKSYSLPKRSVDTYRDLYSIPGLEPWRR